MNKALKKIICFATAATLSAGALSLVACGSSFTPVAEDVPQSVESNGGFVVSTDKYYYFINGIDANTADNTYGKVEKASLMRVKKENADKGENGAETVVPSLIVAGQYEAGFFIYGDRIYYTTPSDVKNAAGDTQNDRLDVKSCKTNGSDLTHYYRLPASDTPYRFVEAGEGENKTVYLLYVLDSGKELHSRNLATGADTVLVKNMKSYLFNADDKTDPYVYYTMAVKSPEDKPNSTTYSYDQVYRVRADVTEETASYRYSWDEKGLEEHNDGEIPYVNCGELVLDGIGATNPPTQYNHHLKDGENDVELPSFGYTYTLQKYANGGIYFLRKTVDNGSSQGATGEVYYLAASKIQSGWNSVRGNDVKASVTATTGCLDVVASAINASNASADAIYFIENNLHNYIYFNSTDNGIYRVTAKADNSGATEGAAVQIVYNASGTKLVSIDSTDADYKYVYYTMTSGSNLSVNRAVYNGEQYHYSNLQVGDVSQDLYKAVRILNIEHANSWYPFEILDNTLFYANAESFDSVLYNYVYTVNLKTASGKLMNNAELKAQNDKLEKMTGTDGYLSEEAPKVSAKYATAVRYFYYTGKTEQFYENLKFAKDEGKSDKWIEKNVYNEKEKDAFEKFTALFKDGDKTLTYATEGENEYYTLAYFTNMIGKMSKADEETYSEYWKTNLAHYAPPDAEDTGLAWWAWLLIGLAIGVVVAGAVVTIVLVVRKKKSGGAPAEEKMQVDTTDDREVDVYGESEEKTAEAVTEPLTEEEEAEIAEETAEPEAVEAEEAPAQEAEAPAEEAAKEEEAQPAQEAETPESDGETPAE